MLLDGRGRLALADFGIARLGLEDQITQTGQVLGTAAYLSPEQAMGEPSTPASDRYALAVVAFELLTGSKPFEAENFAAQARAHVDDEPPDASLRDPDLPRAVDGVLARGMAKEPADRWESGAAFVRALDDALSAPLAPARTPPLPRAAAPAATATAPAARDRRPVAGRHRGPGRAGPLRRRRDRAALARRRRRGGRRRRADADRDRHRDARADVDAGAHGHPDGHVDPGADGDADADTDPTATPTPTPTPTEEPDTSGGGGGSAADLQAEAFRLNNAGRPEAALPVAAQAVERCQGSDAVDPCAYALFEYAKALRLTGDPAQAIAVLEERKQRFPRDQPAAVERELALARKAAGG